DFLVPIDPLEEECLETLFGGGGGRGKGDQRPAQGAHVLGGHDAGGCDAGCAGRDVVLDGPCDHASLEFVGLAVDRNARIALQHFLDDGARHGHVNEVFQRHQLGTQGIVYVVGIVGDVVGNGGDLRFETGVGRETQV